MKKLGIIILTIMFGCALFVGQSFGADKMEKQKTGAMDQQTQMETQQKGQTPDINKASELIGKSVTNQQGEELGELQEIVFDKQGKINYIILSKGGVLGMGGELIPIPWQAANARVEQDSLTVSLDKQKLSEAPNIKEGEMNKLSEQQFQQEVRGYYGQGQGTGMEQDMQQQEWKQQDQKQIGRAHV